MEHAHSPRPEDGITATPVLVIGSANVDVSVTAERLPRPGETVRGEAALIGVGGKGANQAVAAALNGVATRLVARLGEDDFGRLVRAALAARGVGTEWCVDLAGQPTGLAQITVDRKGQNMIVVAPGANDALRPEDLEALAPAIRAASVLVLQCEIPLVSVEAAIRIAAAGRTRVLFNPAPCQGVDLHQLPRGIEILVPNESEAAALSGLPVDTLAQAAACAEHLHGIGFPCVVITLGAQGCVRADDSGVLHLPAPAVPVRDTTGAGDAFLGCLAAGLAEGRARDAAIERALVYASLATTRRGALASFPDHRELAEALAAQAPGAPGSAPGRP